MKYQALLLPVQSSILSLSPQTIMHQKDLLQDEGQNGVSTATAAFRSPVGGGTGARPLTLPPDTTLEKFGDFITKLKDVVGEENVTVISNEDELMLEDYTNPSKAHDVGDTFLTPGLPGRCLTVKFQMYYVAGKDYFVSSAVVAPRNVPDVQAIMRLCNDFEIPAWPFSIGRNVGYGGAAPRVPGSIGLDMGRNMNKILDVNVDGAYAFVEPGVTFM